MGKIINNFKEMPWKNGGGTTKEIFRIPHPDNADDFCFRVSMATVHQSGPFSKFPGIQRFLMLLSGNGFILNKKITFQQPMDRFEFSGSDEYYCELINGSCTDFNVMTDEKWGKASINVTSLKKGEDKNFQSTYLFLYKSDPEFILLEPQETIRLEAKEDVIAIEIQINREVG